jgi:hypothetical protein
MNPRFPQREPHVPDAVIHVSWPAEYGQPERSVAETTPFREVPVGSDVEEPVTLPECFNLRLTTLVMEHTPSPDLSPWRPHPVDARIVGRESTGPSGDPIELDFEIHDPTAKVGGEAEPVESIRVEFNLAPWREWQGGAPIEPRPGFTWGWVVVRSDGTTSYADDAYFIDLTKAPAAQGARGLNLTIGEILIA